MLKELFESLGKIVYYPCGAGGKFILNSLGLSRHSVLNNVDLALWDIKQTVYNEDYYNQKLEMVLTTVPNSADDRDWQKYELTMPVGGWQTHDCQYTKPVLEHHRVFFVIVHLAEQVDDYLAKYPNMQVIKLTNYTDWVRYSAFKLANLEKDLENKVNYWKYIDNKEIKTNKFNPILIDLDNNILDQARMQQAIGTLYEQLGFDDFQPELWSQYHRKYLQAHSKVFENGHKIQSY